jgi:decaprenyl-phosphate phosphoribosyltransferase
MHNVKSDSIPPILATWKDYCTPFRFNDWPKNLVCLGGSLMALELMGWSQRWGTSAPIALVAASLISFANYGINDVVDAKLDAQHQRKKFRLLAIGLLRPRLILLGSALLAIIAIFICWVFVGTHLVFSVGALLVAGFVYNIEPLRLKMVPYLDVVSESVNNPIRIWIGWSAITSDGSPPWLVLVSSWAGGALLMTAKRYAELREAGSPEKAAIFRPSFASYTECRLMFMYGLYSIMALTLFTWFAVLDYAYLLISLPFWLLVVITVYFHMRQLPMDTGDPEKLPTQISIVGVLVLASTLTAILLVTN